MPRIMLKRIVSVLAAMILLSVVGYFAFLELSPPESQNLSAPPKVADNKTETTTLPGDHHKFVGSEQCRECHQTLYDSYLKHPMANSVRLADFLPPGADSVPAVVLGLTRDYRVTFQKGEMSHLDEMSDGSGTPIYSQSMKMDYAVGSGQRAYAYLRQEGELLFQSPLNWYTEQACWDVAPGYRQDDPRRFRRRVTEDCLSCHAGRVALTSDLPNRYETPAFHEMRIGCERCHGPGLDHIQYHRDHSANGSNNAVVSATKTEKRDPIVNPGSLSESLRDSVCNQCHVPAAARIVRFGKSEFSFRPGQEMNEHWTVLDAGAGVDETGMTQAVNHVQQMQDSQCYIASKGALGCISCHDPHSVPATEQKAAFYRARCMKCHDSADCSTSPETRTANDDSCIACHMPHRDSRNIAHVTQTDHRILRREENAQSPEPTEAGSDSTRIQLRFLDPQDKQLPKWEQSRAMGVGMFSYLARKGQPAPTGLADLLAPALRENPDDGLVLATLGALALQHQQSETAEQFFDKALHDPGSRESSLMGLLELRYQSGQWDEALTLADQCLANDPGHPGLHAIRADVLLKLGRTQDAIAAGRTSIALDPSVISVREWLLTVYQKESDSRSASELAAEIARMKSARSKGAVK